MGKVQRLTHKQIEAAIKRDELKEFLAGSGEWVKGHLENVLIGVVVAALLAFGAVYLVKNKRDDAIKASSQLSEAEQKFARAQGSGDLSAYESAKAAYEQVRSNFDGRDEAVTAELGLANLALATGKLDEARAAFEKFIASHGDSAMASLASSGLAACLEASGKLKEAADAYLSLAQRRPISAVTAPSYLDAARVFEALKDRVKLKEATAGLEKMDADRQLSDSLKNRLQALKKRIEGA